MLIPQTLGTDVRDAVALRIGPADARVPRQIGPETVRGTQTRTFPDQNEHNLRLQLLTDLVSDRNPPLFDRNQGRPAPTFRIESRGQSIQQRKSVTMDGERG